MIALVMCFAGISFGQDTIVLTSNDTLICDINSVTDSTILYKFKGYNKTADLESIKYYSYSKEKLAKKLAKTEKENLAIEKRNSIIEGFVIDTTLSLEYNLVRMSSEINNINLRLDIHHQQFKTGFTVSLVGAAVSTIGFAVFKKNVDAGATLLTLGSVTTFVGGAIMIDSDKWFKKR
jgi:hypothetical protein